MLRVIMVGLLVVAVGGMGTVAYVMLGPSRPATSEAAAPVPVERVAVLGTARAVRAGTLLKLEDLIPVLVPVDALPEGHLLDTPAMRAEIAGGLVRRALRPNEPLLTVDVLRPGEHGFLAAVLSPGTRAIAVAVDAVTGAAGLIWPGDRVDVILTQTLDETNTPSSRRFAGETVLSGLRVIAVDQHMVQGAMESPTVAGGIVASARTVTVEVSPRDAEKMAVAARLGRLSFIIRSALLTNVEAPADPVVAEPVTWAGDVSGALRGGDGRPGPPGAVPMRVFNGPVRGEEVRF